MFDTDFAIQKIIADAGIPEQQARSFVRMASGVAKLVFLP